MSAQMWYAGIAVLLYPSGWNVSCSVFQVSMEMSPAESAKRKICALHHLSTRSQSVKSECKIHSFFAKQNPLSEALVEIRSPGLHFNCRICHVLSVLCPSCRCIFLQRCPQVFTMLATWPDQNICKMFIFFTCVHFPFRIYRWSSPSNARAPLEIWPKCLKYLAAKKPRTKMRYQTVQGLFIRPKTGIPGALFCTGKARCQLLPDSTFRSQVQHPRKR